MSELVRKALGGLARYGPLGTMFFVGSQSFVPLPGVRFNRPPHQP